MAKAILILLSVLSILPEQTHDCQIDVVAAQKMKEREIFLNEKMTQMWEEIEWTRPLEEVSLLVIVQHWIFWMPASAVIYWLLWQWKAASRRRYYEEMARREEEAKKLDDDPFAEFTLSPTLDLPYMGRTLKKVVRDLLAVCRVLSQNTFMPELCPATGIYGVTESWNDLEDQVLYQLTVYLKAPPGHFFWLQLSGGMDQPRRLSTIHVGLECTCSRMTGDTVCFVHPKRINQHSRLMSTLCTDRCLDREKFAIWVQNLVEAAWERLPHWHDWELRVLSSPQCCKVQLSGASDVQLCAELTFAVPETNLGMFLFLE